MAEINPERYFGRMKNIALALLASTALFACSEPTADDDATGSSEEAYSFTDPPRAIQLEASAVHVTCTSDHGSFVVLTFEDRIFTGYRDRRLAECVALRDELAGRTAPVTGTLVEEHGAINRGILDLDVGPLALQSVGD